MSVSFGDLVRRGREEAGLSQSRLALLIGKSPTTIRAWEHGRTNPADPGAVAALAAVLGLDEAELLGRAGFELPAARTRPSARQELNNLASERTEMIALAALPEAPVKPVKTGVAEPDLLDSPVTMETAPEHAAEADVDVKTATTAPISPSVPPVDVPKPKLQFSKLQIPKLPILKLPIAKPKVSSPKTRIVVTQQVPPTAAPISSNGYVGGRSYLEDEAEKDFYRRRGVITAVVLVFMVIVIWWALGRTGGAIGDLIESIVGLLDI
jgi:transcriptional regulator with XRE-family HTH domain